MVKEISLQHSNQGVAHYELLQVVMFQARGWSFYTGAIRSCTVLRFAFDSSRTTITGLTH